MTDRTADGPPFIVMPQRQDHLIHHVEANLPPGFGPRFLHISADLVPGADIYVTSRTVSGLTGPGEPNVLPHTHEVSQTYLVLSPDGSLEVEVEADGRQAIARAPATIFIPAGSRHTIRVLRGTGTVVAVVRSGEYA